MLHVALPAVVEVGTVSFVLLGCWMQTLYGPPCGTVTEYAPDATVVPVPTDVPPAFVTVTARPARPVSVLPTWLPSPSESVNAVPEIAAIGA